MSSVRFLGQLCRQAGKTNKASSASTSSQLEDDIMLKKQRVLREASMDSTTSSLSGGFPWGSEQEECSSAARDNGEDTESFSKLRFREYCDTRMQRLAADNERLASGGGDLAALLQSWDGSSNQMEEEFPEFTSIRNLGPFLATLNL